MKVTAFGLLILSVFSCACVQTPSQTTAKVSTPVITTKATPQATQELHAGVVSYNDGDFRAAQQHFEQAAKLDPAYKFTQFFLAVVLNAEYRIGDQAPSNIAFAQKAITSFKNYLAIDPQNEMAFGLVAALYGRLGEKELQRTWLLERAQLETAPKEQRAECYLILASQHLLVNNVNNDAARNNNLLSEGLELIEKAIAMDPSNATAREYQVYLFRDKADVARDVGQTTDSARYRNQAENARQRFEELNMKSPRADADASYQLTGDAQLDGMLQFEFKLGFLIIPVPDRERLDRKRI
jgi:tetratricopeptide (TPR) repeat protein